MRFSDFSTFTQRAALPFPTYSYFHLWQSALPLLRSLLAKKDLPLRLVGVKVEDLQAGRDILPFFSLRDEKMTAGIGSVKERFGFSALRNAAVDAAGGAVPGGKGRNGAQDGVVDEIETKAKGRKGKSEEQEKSKR